jgi:hypothetical protein
MAKVETRQKQQTRCAGCSQIVPNYDIVNLGSVEKGYRVLCGKCFNTEMAKLDGLDGFEHVTFEPVQLTTAPGNITNFTFEPICSVPESPWMVSSFVTVARPGTNFRLSAIRRKICWSCSGD